MSIIKSIIKTGAKAAVAFGAAQLGGQLFGPTGAKFGKALGASLMARGGGADMGTVSGQYIPRNINLSQFGMGTYQAGAARSTPIQQISTDPLRLRAEWDYSLREYMLLGSIHHNLQILLKLQNTYGRHYTEKNF